MLAVEWLFEQMRTEFPAGNHVFGWREATRRSSNETRIVWTPGDVGGAVGRMTPIRVNAPTRTLWSLHEFITWRIHASDDTARENELASYRATRLLADEFLRRLYLKAHGSIRIASLSWEASTIERRFGAMIVCVGELFAEVPDTTPTTFRPTFAAQVTSQGHTEPLHVPDPLPSAEALMSPLYTRSHQTAHAGTTRDGYLGGATNTLEVEIPAGGAWLRQCPCSAYASSPGAWVAGSVTPRISVGGTPIANTIPAVTPAAPRAQLTIPVGTQVWLTGGSVVTIDFVVSADFNVGGSAVIATAMPVFALPVPSEDE